MLSNKTKHNSRIILIQKLFEQDFFTTKIDTEFVNHYSETSLKEFSDITEIDKPYILSIMEGLKNHKKEVDELILKLAPEWPLANIAKIDLEILRIAVLEGFILKITPEKVAINEAIELAKEFSNDQTRKFVSGVLGNLFSNKEKYI
jgi:N utilization substance protein B